MESEEQEQASLNSWVVFGGKDIMLERQKKIMQEIWEW